MNCPYCKRLIYAMTGFQEVTKFQKHLKTCKKRPDRLTVVTDKGDLVKIQPNVNLLDALKIRSDSGQ